MIKISRLVLLPTAAAMLATGFGIGCASRQTRIAAAPPPPPTIVKNTVPVMVEKEPALVGLREEAPPVIVREAPLTIEKDTEVFSQESVETKKSASAAKPIRHRVVKPRVHKKSPASTSFESEETIREERSFSY